MLDTFLQACGLTTSEGKIFTTLLQHGATIAGMIAKHLNMKRPTVYAALDHLCDYGLVYKTKKGSTTYFSPIAIDMISEILQDREDRLYEEKKKAIASLALKLPLVQTSSFRDMGGVNLSTLDSREAVYMGVKKMLFQGGFLSIFNPQEIFHDARMRKITLDFLQETAQSKKPIREIIVHGPEALWYKNHVCNPFHQVKELPAEKKVILCDYDPPPEVMVTIERKDFFESMKTMFELIWNSLPS
jgi:predicted transcriptional regulator